MKPVDNPWLRIPAEEYEGHMGDSEVQQLQFLSRKLEEQLRIWLPRHVMIAGCATGNGLELEAIEHCERIVGIDINPDYLELARKRFGSRLTQLELICADIENEPLSCGEFDLIFAALLFEYVDPVKVLPTLEQLLATRGVLIVILQQPGDRPAVTSTKWDSLRQLESFMTLRDRDEFCETAKRAGLKQIRSFKLYDGKEKQFFMGIYQTKKTQNR